MLLCMLSSITNHLAAAAADGGGDAVLAADGDVLGDNPLNDAIVEAALAQPRCAFEEVKSSGGLALGDWVAGIGGSGASTLSTERVDTLEQLLAAATEDALLVGARPSPKEAPPALAPGTSALLSVLARAATSVPPPSAAVERGRSVVETLMERGPKGTDGEGGMVEEEEKTRSGGVGDIDREREEEGIESGVRKRRRRNE